MAIREYKELKNLMRSNEEMFDKLENRQWFLLWLKDNISIYNEFERYSIYLSEHGKRTRYSARAIIHRMRWDTLIKEKEPTEFKISNNCTPYLARITMLANPRLAGMFQLRANKK